MKITVDTSRAKRKINSLMTAVNSIPWLEIGELVEQSVHTNFIAGGRYDNEESAYGATGGRKKWAKRKNENKLNHPILIKTGSLKRATTFSTIKNGIVVKNITPYAPYHQFGTVNMKPRPFMVLQNEDKKQINKIVKNHFKETILK